MTSLESDNARLVKLGQELRKACSALLSLVNLLVLTTNDEAAKVTAMDAMEKVNAALVAALEESQRPEVVTVRALVRGNA